MVALDNHQTVDHIQLEEDATVGLELLLMESAAEEEVEAVELILSKVSSRSVLLQQI